ncbi:MAG: hypothetical protein ACREPV_08460 [Lysobacter sp.]
MSGRLDTHRLRQGLEVLNCKRGLTIRMIRNLHRSLGIPAESLIGVAAIPGRDH